MRFHEMLEMAFKREFSVKVNFLMHHYYAPPEMFAIFPQNYHFYCLSLAVKFIFHSKCDCSKTKHHQTHFPRKKMAPIFSRRRMIDPEGIHDNERQKNDSSQQMIWVSSSYPYSSPSSI